MMLFYSVAYVGSYIICFVEDKVLVGNCDVIQLS